MNGLGNEFFAFGLLFLMCMFLLGEDTDAGAEKTSPRISGAHAAATLAAMVSLGGMLSIVFISLYRSLR